LTGIIEDYGGTMTNTAESVLNSLPVAAGTEVVGKIEFVNDALCRLTGYKRSELKGNSIKILFNDNIESERITILQKIFRHGNAGIAATIKTKLGKPVNVFCRFSILNSDNRLPGIVFTITRTDTEGEEFEEVNRKGMMLEEIFSSIKNSLAIIRASDHKIIKSSRDNSSFTDDKCYSLLYGRSLPCKGENHLCPLAGVKETKKPVVVEHKIIDKSGKPSFREIHAYPVLNENGDVEKIIEYSVDITESKRTGNNNAEWQNQLNDVYENATIGIYRTTPEGKFIFANPAAMALLGYTSINDLLNANLVESHIEIYDRKTFKNIMEKEGTIFGFESKWKRKDGVVIFIRESARTIRDENNETRYYEGVVEDITEKKKAETELMLAKEQAEEMSRIKSNFLANMSHELRTPLCGILGFAEMLGEEIEDSFHKELVASIYHSGSRLLKTLNSLLNFSKIESEKIELNYEKINILASVASVIDTFRKETEYKNLQLELDNNTEEKFAELDSTLFQQIVSNLIENAIKYTKEGKVTVAIDTEERTAGDWIVIKVIDTGIGIPGESQLRIFDAFRQASEGLTRKYEGTGLGLAITKKYVELMDGKISVESVPGIGSTFTVKFPASASFDDGNKNSKLSNITQAELQNENKLPDVLLVENEPSSVDITKHFLKDICFIDDTDNGSDAIIMLMEKKYEVIIMDIDLAGSLDGMETTQEIRKLRAYKDIPIIALTAYAMKGDKEKCFASGCSHYMSKPFNKEEIASLVKSVLNEYSVKC